MVYTSNSDCWMLLVKLVSSLGSACKKPMRQGIWCNIVIGKGFQTEKGKMAMKGQSLISLLGYITAQSSESLENTKKLHRTASESSS